MAENLEPDPTDPAEVAARATKKMMEGAGLQSAEEMVLNPEAVAAMLVAQKIALLALVSFMVEASIEADKKKGIKTPAKERADMLTERLHRIAGTFPEAHSARVLQQLDSMTAWLLEYGPKE
jgi:hypothetical protein